MSQSDDDSFDVDDVDKRNQMVIELAEKYFQEFLQQKNQKGVRQVVGASKPNNLSTVRGRGSVKFFEDIVSDDYKKKPRDTRYNDNTFVRRGRSRSPRRERSRSRRRRRSKSRRRYEEEKNHYYDRDEDINSGHHRNRSEKKTKSHYDDDVVSSNRDKSIEKVIETNINHNDTQSKDNAQIVDVITNKGCTDDKNLNEQQIEMVETNLEKDNSVKIEESDIGKNDDEAVKDDTN
ncbi:hypothetical protein QTN25_009595 [Entamoeba marina]